ncbi:AAA family ATPase [Neorhizobium sp. DAR64872/K0K18]|uniref:AAA family ATPase n=1 Tax=Neorhizobium sp. DAR64872/K0K18 TaxID=3421958 RepID=UPI003D2E2794
MKVIYKGRYGGQNAPKTPSEPGDVLELLDNNWNDYGFETTFNTACRIGEETLELGLIKVLFEGSSRSREFLKSKLDENWDGTFPITEVGYVSVPLEISFYEQLVSQLGEVRAIEVALALKDASFLINTRQDAEAIRIRKLEGFETSLQRERGEEKAFADGWKILAKEAIAVSNLDFRFTDAQGSIQEISFKYQSTNLLPSDINVLIGPNGVGKSRLLHQIVDDWIQNEPHEDRLTGFTNRPSLSQLVVLSYSPFENFPASMPKDKRQDADAYRYFGLRSDTQGQGNNTALSLDTPKMATAHSLLACLADDIRFRSMREWAKKLATVENVLRSAFDFDFAAVEVDPNASAAYANKSLFDPTELVFRRDGRRYVAIRSSSMSRLDPEAIAPNIVAESGVLFFKDDRLLELSSGQRLFSYIVINLLGVMRRNSLILIDEPELFLHPSLEIQLVEMLKEILKHFSSKALFATHSIVTVREVPADCVHVFSRTDDGIQFSHPPFQTFGGDVQRITSYVFGDRAVTKPFEAWIDEQLRERSAAELIGLLGPALNEEMIIQIAAKGR